MRLPLLLSAGALLVALLSCPPCGALRSRRPVPGASLAPQPPQPPQPRDVSLWPPQPRQQPARPVLLRLGEEYFLRLGHRRQSPAAPFAPTPSPPASGSGGRLSPDEAAVNFFRALLLRSRSRLDSPGAAERRAEGALDRQEAPERKRRSQEPPISLDLTFHILRQMMDMARAEQLAQQAHSNRKLMEMIGK